MTVFGYNFDFLDEQVVLELASLEREGAIYTHMWIEYAGFPPRPNCF
jgi:hypothetical protein